MTQFVVNIKAVFAGLEGDPSALCRTPDKGGTYLDLVLVLVLDSLSVNALRWSETCGWCLIKVACGCSGFAELMK